MFNQAQVQQQLINVRQIQGILDRITSEAGTQGVYLVEESGFLIAEAGNIEIDRVALAALVAASFGATTEIAKLLGEESFTQLTQQGADCHLFICKAGERHIVIAAFGKETNLGLVKLYVEKAVIHLGAMLDYEPPTLTMSPTKPLQEEEEQPSLVVTDEEFTATEVQEEEELAAPEEIDELEAGILATLTEESSTEPESKPTDTDNVAEAHAEEVAKEEPAEEVVLEESETAEAVEKAEVDIEVKAVEEPKGGAASEDIESTGAEESGEADVEIEAVEESAVESGTQETAEKPVEEDSGETALEVADRVAEQLRELVGEEEEVLEQDKTKVGDTDEITGETTEKARGGDAESEIEKLKKKGFIDIPRLDEDERMAETDETIDLDVDKELEKLLEEGIVRITGMEEDVSSESEGKLKSQPDAGEIESTDEETDSEIARLTTELRQEIAQLRTESE